MGALLVLFLLMLAVAIHEYGHYTVMRRNGVTVTEFSVGLGPLLFQRKLKSGTQFSIRMIPLGGYAMPVKQGPGSMDGLGFWPRFRIFMAGMFANALTAFVILTAINYSTGDIPAFMAPYVTWAPKPLAPLAAAFLMSFGLWLAGPAIIIGMAVSRGALFFTQDAAGPVGIVSQGAQFMTSLPAVAGFFAIIHIALAMFNLLPLMPLDGGQVARDIVAKIFGKKTAKWFTLGGIALMLAFFLFIMVSDIVKLFMR
jgi:regulator of sigma E protease